MIVFFGRDIFMCIVGYDTDFKFAGMSFVYIAYYANCKGIISQIKNGDLADIDKATAEKHKA